MGKPGAGNSTGTGTGTGATGTVLSRDSLSSREDSSKILALSESGSMHSWTSSVSATASARRGDAFSDGGYWGRQGLGRFLQGGMVFIGESRAEQSKQRLVVLGVMRIYFFLPGVCLFVSFVLFCCLLFLLFFVIPNAVGDVCFSTF